jgi:hypothetical protein
MNNMHFAFVIVAIGIVLGTYWTKVKPEATEANKDRTILLMESAHQQCEWLCSGDVDYVRLDLKGEVYECSCLKVPPTDR